MSKKDREPGITASPLVKELIEATFPPVDRVPGGRAMTDAARAKPVVESCLDDGHERADHQVFVVCITCTTNAHVAEQTAALGEENARLRGALFDLVEYAKAWRLDVESAPMHSARSLLADPEGQP